MRQKIFSLPEATCQALRHLSNRTRISEAELVRQALGYFLLFELWDPTEPQGEAVKAQAKRRKVRQAGGVLII